MSIREQLAQDAQEITMEAGDTYAVFAGLLTLHLGAEMAYSREPTIFWGVASVYVFGSALLLVGAGLSDVDLERWGKPLAFLAFTSVMTAVGITYIMIQGMPIGTDALAFVNQAAATLLAGRSPYIVEMTLGRQWPTPMVMGGTVGQYSYPIGSALLVAPFRAVLEDGARVAVIGSTLGTGLLLLWAAPGHLAPLAYSSMLVGQFATWGVGDLTDPLWVLPLAVALVYWPWAAVGPDSLWASGLLYGVATAVKQQPWFCAPFLLIWVWRERGARTAAGFVGMVSAVFWTVHAPVIAMAPRAALTGLLTNLVGPEGTLVHLGVGLSALTLSGALPMAKTGHTVLMAVAGVSGLGLYWRSFDRIRWLAWIAWAPLLFFNYRSLANYFVVVAPIGTLVLFARGVGRDP